MDLMIHVANVLYMLSYLVRDILWLRVLTVIAATCLLPYFYFRPEPLMAPIYWNLTFTGLNVYWIGRLLLERRPVALTAEQERLRNLAFESLTAREMLHLLGQGTWVGAEPPACFVRSGRPVDRLMVIESGRAGVEVAGRSVSELGAGSCVGAMSFYTDAEAAADVRAIEPTRYVSWPKGKLKAFLERNPSTRAAFQTLLVRELASRLQASWVPRPEGSRG